MEKNNNDGKTRLQRLLEGDIPAFMEDNSFLTPWKWDPTKNNEIIAPSSQKKQLDFGADHESYFSHNMVPTEKNEIIASSSQKKQHVFGAESSFHHDMARNLQKHVPTEKSEIIAPSSQKKDLAYGAESSFHHDTEENKLIVKEKEEDKPAVEKKKENKPHVEEKKEDEPILPVNNQSHRMMKVKDLRPKMEGIDIIVKVVEVKIIRSDAPRVTESFVGDETGTIIFTALGNHQVKRVKTGSTIRLKNAKIDMFKSCMRLKVQKPQDIEEVSPASFIVMVDNNLSLIEWDCVQVAT